jgi:hypothetical protein
MSDQLAYTYAEAGALIGLSEDYVRRSDIPKTLLPGTGPKGRPLPRILRTDLEAWIAKQRKAA